VVALAWWLGRWGVAVVLLVVVLPQLGSFRLPRVSDLQDPGMIPVAILAETVSMLAAVRVQQLLLTSSERPPRAGAIARITLAATSIGYVLPGGPALGGLYSARRYGVLGVEPDAAAGSQLVSSSLFGASIGALGILGYLTGNEHEFSDSVTSGAWHVFGVVSVVFTLACVAAAVVCRSARTRRRLASSRLVARFAGIPAPTAAATGRPLVTVPVLLRVTALSLVILLADLGCLLACLALIEVPFDGDSVLPAYALTAVLGLLPFTPGGLGLVEGGLAVLLAVPDSAQDRLGAAVLIYRLLSYWVLVAIGLLILSADGGLAAAGARRSNSP
jgi:uncharacterized membrane protein YbhN (UPF0104 family)